MKGHCLPLLVWLCVIGAVNVSAQDEQPGKSPRDSVLNVDTEEIDERAADLIGRIRSSIAQLDAYLYRLNKASAEDSLVMGNQIDKIRVSITEDLHELADVVVDLEKNAPQPALRRQVEDAFNQVTPAIWFHINRLRDEIDAERAKRTATPPDELVTLEDRIGALTTRLDDFFTLAVDHVGEMGKLGLDDSDARKHLSELLTSRAEELYARIDFALLRIDKLEAQLKKNPDTAGARGRLIAAHMALATNTKSARATLNLMDGMDIDTVRYREQLVAATRDLGRGLLDRGVAAKLIARWWRQAKAWVADSGPGFLVKLLLFLAILYVGRLAGNVARRGVRKALDASRLSPSRLLRRMILSAVANVVFLLAVLLALSQIGISLGPLLAGLGVAGFIVGFALQDTLANFAAGMMILFYRPYDVGDVVEAGGVFGKVDKMSLVSTTILTFDNQEMVVPNKKIWGDVIKNVTAQNIRRVDMTFGISYGDNIPKAKAILEDILQKHEKVLDDPASVVRVHTLNESSVDFICRPWVKVADYWDVYWDVTQEVKMRFDAEGVSIPFPQRDVHIYPENTKQKDAVLNAPQANSNAGLTDDPHTGKDDDEPTN